jgi:hypothetical protein
MAKGIRPKLPSWVTNHRFIRDLGPKGWRQPANSDHVYKSGDQYDPGGEHEDFVKFEARN